MRHEIKGSLPNGDTDINNNWINVLTLAQFTQNQKIKRWLSNSLSSTQCKTIIQANWFDFFL